MSIDLTVDRDDLIDAALWTAASLPTRPPVQALLGLLLEADEPAGTLTISGFDYDASRRTTINAKVASSSRTLVPGRLLADIVRTLPPEPVTLVAEGSRVTLLCGPARFVLPTMDDRAYPALPALPPVAGTVAAGAFADAVGQVAIAAATTESQPALAGVRLEVEATSLVLVATDRYRLAVRRLPWTAADAGDAGAVLVPAKALADTAKALAGGGDISLLLSQKDGLLGFRADRLQSTTRLIDEQYPPYARLLPDTANATALVERVALTEAVKRVQLVALAAARNAPVVRLSFADGDLLVEAGGQSDAFAAERLDCGYSGEPMETAFNPTYLLDGLAAIGGDGITFSLTAPTRPSVLTSSVDVAGSAADYRYLLMPVRVAQPT